jgi:hypothetical protein
MNIRISRPSASGHIMLIVLVMVGILVAAMGTYLTLTSQENTTVMRSLAWNSALPLAEAGIDEAMSHLASNTNSLAVDGWSSSTGGYSKQRALSNDYYHVNLSGDLNSLVTITSTGAVQWIDGTYITRTVQVTARARNYPSPIGLVAKDITFQGSLSIDSYDSSDPNYCDPTKMGWYDPTKVSDKAFVGNPLITFNVGGSASVKGYIASGRGAPAPTVTGAGTVGDTPWTGSSKGAQAGHATNGFFYPFLDVRVPYLSGSALTPGTINGFAYTYVLTGQDYFAANLAAAANLYVATNSRLYVTGSVDIASVTFATNSRLDLYISAPAVTFNPYVTNGAPTQFIVWGLPTCTSMTMTSVKFFVGTIYAPEANLSAGGGSQFYGAMAANTFKATGSFKWHYDLGTGKKTPPEALTMLSWAEL